MKLHPEREKRFPNLRGSGYRVTSSETIDRRHPRYNCIAFAAGDETLWWWPDQHGIGFWPEGVPREVNREAFIRAFGTLGYEVCQRGKLEPGYEKIAIYERNGVPAHAAKQLEDGRWKSKLGAWEDIEHDTVDAVESSGGMGLYGEVALYIRRKRE